MIHESLCVVSGFHDLGGVVVSSNAHNASSRFDSVSNLLKRAQIQNPFGAGQVAVTAKGYLNGIFGS
jgi:hypothetical protein